MAERMRKFEFHLRGGQIITIAAENCELEWSRADGRLLRWNLKGLKPDRMVYIVPEAVDAVMEVG